MKFQLAVLLVTFQCLYSVDACPRKCPTCPKPCPKVKQAKAVFYGGAPTGTSITGTITFTANSDNTVTISGTLNNIPNGNHGFHVHTLGNLGACTNALGHYNPFNKNHGGPTDSVRHVGDLGNIVATSNMTTVNLRDSLVKLDGENNIIGRMLVVHQNRDDLGKGGNAGSLSTGNAGSRIACAVIGISG